MPFSGQFNAAGLLFSLESDRDDIGQYLASCLAPFAAGPAAHVEQTRKYQLAYEARRCLPGTAFPAPHVLRVDGELVWSAPSAAALVEHALWLISQHAIAAVADRVAVHAGAASRCGVAVLLPAPPDSGKTTLVAGLVNAGFSYLTDEMALISATTGWVDPFPRALWMDRRSVALIPGLSERVAQGLVAPDAAALHVRPDDLRPGAIGQTCRIGAIVTPRYEPGATTAMEPMSRAEMLRYLVLNSPNMDAFGRRALDVLARAVSRAACYRLTFSDLDVAVHRVGALVDAVGGETSTDLDAPPLLPLRTVARATDPTVVADAIDAAFRPRPAAAVAAAELDGEVVLYDTATGQTHLLNSAASALWSCFDGESSIEEIATDVADIYGRDLAEVQESAVTMARALGRLGVLDGVVGDASERG